MNKQLLLELAVAAFGLAQTGLWMWWDKRQGIKPRASFVFLLFWAAYIVYVCWR
jgi:hypothetical protein